METIQGNMLIAQSGGPTAVINQSLIGAVTEALKQDSIKNIYGALHGIQGILDENLIDLKAETAETLEAVANLLQTVCSNGRYDRWTVRVDYYMASSGLRDVTRIR